MALRGKKILEEIHPLTIIREVQKWPVLYARDSLEPANMHFKNKIWNEVAKALFCDWDSFSDAERECKISDLTKKWRNLRDTFKRQLETEKRIREGQEVKKKTYVYFKHMLFLLPHVTSSENEATEPTVDPKLNEFFNKCGKRKSSTDKKSFKIKKYLEKHPPPTKSVIISGVPSKSSDQEEIDEDKHFLMSLVPSFKKMSDDEKLEVKVEILKVIKNVRTKSYTVECQPVADSLSFNPEETGMGTVKIEMITEGNYESHYNGSESPESEHSD